MTPRLRWTLWALAGLGTAAVALGVAAVLLVPGDEELAARITAQAQANLGVKVTLGAVHWELLPTPVLVIVDAATVQPAPIRFRRLAAQPNLFALLGGKLRFDHVLIDGGVMPQLSLRGLRIQSPPSGAPDGALSGTAPPVVEHLRFRNLTWITRYGKPLEFDGTARFDALWRPRLAQVLRPGVQPAAQITLEREGEADRWRVQLLLGGGTAHGQVTLKTQQDGKLVLSGELAPRDVEVNAALAAFKRYSAVHGKAFGHTQLTASGTNVGELAGSLHTRTTFSISGALLLHMDVDKAIRTAGTDRAGQTPLQALTGQMDTQNTPEGMVVRYSAIQARGETFSASGGGTIANRRVNGEMTVQLAGGLVGVPLKVDGPLDAPQVSVPATAVAGAATGAALGTAVLPGIGTVIGAGVGAALGKLFKGGDAKAAPR